MEGVETTFAFHTERTSSSAIAEPLVLYVTSVHCDHTVHVGADLSLGLYGWIVQMRVIVSPAVYPHFLEIAELARSLCHS